MLIKMFRDDWGKDTSLSYRVAYLTSRMFDTSVTSSLVAITFLLKVEIRLSWLWILVLGDLVFPVVFLLESFRSRRIADLDLTSREERKVWVNFLAVFWSGTLIAMVLFNVEPPKEILVFQTWLAILGILNAAITHFWKISGHAMVVTSLVMWLSFLWSPWFALLMPVLIPLVCWARYYTKKHTVAQLAAGVVLMLIVTPLVWIFFGRP